MGFLGDKLIDTSWAGPTVRGVLPVVVPDVAETVTEPCFNAVTRPVELMVANAVFDVAHVALLIGFELPSE